MQYGNDKDEIIIRNAEVIAILRKKGDSNGESKKKRHDK